MGPRMEAGTGYPLLLKPTQASPGLWTDTKGPHTSRYRPFQPFHTSWGAEASSTPTHYKHSEPQCGAGTAEQDSSGTQVIHPHREVQRL